MTTCDATTFVCGWLDCPTHGRPDDGGPVADPCTPYVGEHWQVAVVRLSEHHFKTVFSSGNRHFVLADADDAEEALVHCTHIRDCFLAALGDVRAREPLTRGALANRRIALGSEIVTLRARLVDLEKISKRTPPKTLASERERVAQAKTELARARELLPRLEEEREQVVEAEAAFSSASETPATRTVLPDYRALLRRAICDCIEPLVLSHLTAGTEWRDAANRFVLECAPLVFGPGESVFGVRPAPSVPACKQEPEQADPVHYLVAFGQTLCGNGAMTRNITGNPHFVTCGACLAKRDRTSLDVRTLEYLGHDFRCPSCLKMMRNHVVVSRHEDGACDETFTGPPLRVYLGEERVHADQGRADLPRPVTSAAEDDEETQGAQGPAGGESRSGERADEADVPRVRPVANEPEIARLARYHAQVNADFARHCGSQSNGCDAPAMCTCGCSSCSTARDVAREAVQPALHYACVNCAARVHSHSMHCATCLRAFNAGRAFERRPMETP